MNLEDEYEDLGTGDENGYSQYPQEYTRLDNLENEGPTFYSSFINEVTQEDVSTPNQSGKAKQSQMKAKISSKPVKMKRKVRESSGSAKFKELITQQNETQQRVLEILESDATSLNQVNKFSISAAISVIDRMVHDGLIMKGSDLWCFAMTLIEDAVKREIFLGLSDDDGRLTWLKYKQNLGN